MLRRTLAAILLVGTLVAGPAAPADAGSSGVRFGALVATRGSESFADAVVRQDTAYGTPAPMPISRVFYNGPVKPWPDKAGASGRPVVVSFQYLPRDVVAGTYDAELRNFFADAPPYDVYWSYFHEPEDNITRGEFTAFGYRNAWRHIADLAATSAPVTAQLHSTLILMCYTLNAASGLDWHKYYVPVAQSMLAFDCYNHAGKYNAYGDPSNIFRPLTNWAAANPLIPWGVSEFGSTLATTDLDGAKRAAWLRSVGTFLVNQHAASPATAALFGIYYDVVGPKGTDYRLMDAKSQAAWRDVVQQY